MLVWIKKQFSGTGAQENPYCCHHSLFYSLGSVKLKDFTRGLKCAFDLGIKIVNYIKSSALNSRVFQTLW